MRIRRPGPIQTKDLRRVGLMRTPIGLQLGEFSGILGDDVSAADEIHAIQSVVVIDLVIDLR